VCTDVSNPVSLASLFTLTVGSNGSVYFHLLGKISAPSILKMKPPHGAGFGYPRLISALFRSTDKSVPSIEGHDAIDNASSDGEQVTGVCQERAIRATKDLVIDLSGREPHPGTATDLSPWALNTYSRESRSSEVSSNATITAPLQPTHATDARNKTAGEHEFEKPDDKQQRTGNKRLTRDQRRDILLMRRLGHKYEDIAKFLGVTQAAVQYTINRGRASPEQHNAGRKKLDRAEVPRHANGRKIRSDVGSSKRASRRTAGIEQNSNGSETSTGVQALTRTDYREPPQMSRVVLCLFPD